MNHFYDLPIDLQNKIYRSLHNMYHDENCKIIRRLSYNYDYKNNVSMRFKLNSIVQYQNNSIDLADDIITEYSIINKIYVIKKYYYNSQLIRSEFITKL